MSDILEDQKIHYIVKDYQRMYNAHWNLKAVIEELQKSLDAKDKEILSLRAKVNELKNNPPINLKPKLAEMENQLKSIVSRAGKVIDYVEEVRTLTNTNN